MNLLTVSSVIKKVKPLVVKKIIDFEEENLYIIVSEPSNLEKDDTFLDGMLKMTKDGKKIAGFNPLSEFDGLFFSLPASRVIYEKR